MIELTRLNTHILDCRAIVINQMPLAQDGPCWFKSFSFYYRICHRIDIGKSGKKIIREGRISLSLTAPFWESRSLGWLEVTGEEKFQL